MFEQAEVVGLEEQLTIRSRNQQDLLDVWVAVRWNVAREEWLTEFNAIAEEERGALCPKGAFEIVSLTDRQGWIVGRGINTKVLTPKDVESVVRGLVARVNARVVGAAISAEPVAQHSWTSRVLGTLAAIDAIIFGFALAARRRRNADVASS